MKNKLLLPGILDRYLLAHYIPLLLVSVAFFSFITVIFYIKEIIKVAVEKGLDAGIIIQLFLYSSGWTLGLTLPMGTLLATILAVGGHNADSEIIAMRASGMTYFRIMRSYLIFSGFTFLFLLWFNIFVVPWCLNQMEVLKAQIIEFDPIAVIEPGRFTILDKTGDVIRKIYVGSISSGSDGREVLNNIQIRKTESGELTEFVIARRGERFAKPESNNPVKALRLFNGYIFRTEINGDTQQIDFHNGSLDLNINEEAFSASKSRNDNIMAMTIGDIRREISDLQNGNLSRKDRSDRIIALESEFHKRFALPASVLFFTFLGFPLGIVNRRSGKGFGLGQSIVFIFIFFGFHFASDSFVTPGSFYRPWMAAWTGNLVLGLLAALFFYARTRDLNLLVELGFITEGLFRIFRKQPDKKIL